MNPREMATARDRVLVIGADHLFDGDDGVGAHVVRHLRSVRWPAHIEIVEGGRSGYELLELMRSAPRVILIDAVSDGLWPGSVTRHRIESPDDLPAGLACHDLGLGDVVASMAGMDAMPQVDLVTISVDEYHDETHGIESELAAGLPGAVRLVRELLC